MAALGQSSLVPALKAWAFTFVLIWESARVPLAVAFSKWVGTRHWHLGKGPEVLKAKSVRPAGNHEGALPSHAGAVWLVWGHRGALLSSEGLLGKRTVEVDLTQKNFSLPWYRPSTPGTAPCDQLLFHLLDRTHRHCHCLPTLTLPGHCSGLSPLKRAWRELA